MTEAFDALRGQRILIVEDDYLVAQVLIDLLSDAGAEVIGPIGWIDEALALITDPTQRLDAAVLDVSLHGAKSYPVADALVARSIRFMFATGYDPDALEEPYRHWPRYQKPFDEAAFIAALGGLLSSEKPSG